jgi:hypothetical protein
MFYSPLLLVLVVVLVRVLGCFKIFSLNNETSLPRRLVGAKLVRAETEARKSEDGTPETLDLQRATYGH